MVLAEGAKAKGDLAKNDEWEVERGKRIFGKLDVRSRRLRVISDSLAAMVLCGIQRCEVWRDNGFNS